MQILLPPKPTGDIALLVSLFEQRRDLLARLDERTAFRPLLDAPAHLDATVDELIGLLRGQVEDALHAGARTVRLSLRITPALSELVRWSEGRFRLATSMIFPGALPAEWERALTLYTELLQDLVAQLPASST